MRLCYLISFVALSLAVFAPSQSQAGVIYYSSAAALNAAVPGLSTDSFSGSGLYTSPYSNAPGLSIGTLVPVPGNLYLQPSGIAPFYFGDTLVVSFAPNVGAFGVTVTGVPASGTNGPSGTLILDILLQGSTTPIETTYALAANTPAFYGAASTTPIRSVDLLFDSNADALTNLSSVEFGAASSSIPEPGSLSLLLLGSFLLAGRSCRVKR